MDSFLIFRLLFEFSLKKHVKNDKNKLENHSLENQTRSLTVSGIRNFHLAGGLKRENLWTKRDSQGCQSEQPTRHSNHTNCIAL